MRPLASDATPAPTPGAREVPQQGHVPVPGIAAAAGLAVATATAASTAAAQLQWVEEDVPGDAVQYTGGWDGA